MVHTVEQIYVLTLNWEKIIYTQFDTWITTLSYKSINRVKSKISSKYKTLNKTVSTKKSVESEGFYWHEQKDLETFENEKKSKPKKITWNI